MPRSDHGTTTPTLSTSPNHHMPHALEPVSELEEPEAAHPARLVHPSAHTNSNHHLPKHPGHPLPHYAHSLNHRHHSHHHLPARPQLHRPHAHRLHPPDTPSDSTSFQHQHTYSENSTAKNAREAEPDLPAADELSVEQDDQHEEDDVDPEEERNKLLAAIHSPPPVGTPPARPALRSSQTSPSLATEYDTGRGRDRNTLSQRALSTDTRSRSRVRFSTEPSQGWTHSGQRYDRHGGPVQAHLTSDDVAELRALEMDLALLEARWAAASHRAAEQGDPMPVAVNVAFGRHSGYQPTSWRIAQADARGLPRDNFPTGPNRELTPTPNGSAAPSQRTSPSSTPAPPEHLPAALSHSSWQPPSSPPPADTPPISLPSRRSMTESDPRSPPQWVTSSETSDTESVAESAVSESEYRSPSRPSSPGGWSRRLSTESTGRERALYLGPRTRTPQPNRRLGRKAHAERVCLMSRFGLLDAPTPPPLPGTLTSQPSSSGSTDREHTSSWAEKQYAAPPPHVQPRAANAHSAHTPWMGSSYTGSYVSGRSPRPMASLDSLLTPGPSTAPAADMPLTTSLIQGPTTAPATIEDVTAEVDLSPSLPQPSDAAAVTNSYFPPQPEPPTRPSLGPRQGSFTQPRASPSTSPQPPTDPSQDPIATPPSSPSTPMRSPTTPVGATGKRSHRTAVAAWTSVGGKRVPLEDKPPLERRGSNRDRERMQRERARARIRAGAPRQTPLIVSVSDVGQDDEGGPHLASRSSVEDIGGATDATSSSDVELGLEPVSMPVPRVEAKLEVISDPKIETKAQAKAVAPVPTPSEESSAPVDTDDDPPRGRSRTPPALPITLNAHESISPSPETSDRALAGRRDPSTGRLAPDDLPPAAPIDAPATTLTVPVVSKWTNKPSRSWKRSGKTEGARTWSFSPRAASVHSASETEEEERKHHPSQARPAADGGAVQGPPISGGARWTQPAPCTTEYDSPASEFTYESGSEYDVGQTIH